MLPSILIIEPRREIAEALADVITSASYTPLVRAHVEHLSDLGVTPAAIIVRITFEGVSEPAHAALERLGPERPPVIALASLPDEVFEAERLNCDVILRAPGGVSRLCDVLAKLVET